MTRRWKWDFEDEQAAARTPSPPALGPPSPPPLAPPPRPGAGAAQLRRRRSAAALALVVLIVVLLVALGGSGHGAKKTSAGSGAGSATPSGVAPSPKPNSEAEGNAAVSRVLAYTPFVRLGGGRSKDIALTFDDGPGPYTPEVLDVLERFHVHATFFAIGRMERYFSASTVRAIRDGDVIGDHTESHPQLAMLSAHDQREQLFEQIVRIELLGGKRPTLFRPPYGSYNAATMRELNRLP